jgi:hypothetical protein
MADNLEDTDFDDILDTWSNCQRHSYRWEGETGVRNFEQLVKDIGYDQGIENFLADNPGAIETLLNWISEHAEKGGSEWKENLAKSCDYKPEDEETDEDEEIVNAKFVSLEEKLTEAAKKKYPDIISASYVPNILAYLQGYDDSPTDTPASVCIIQEHTTTFDHSTDFAEIIKEYRSFIGPLIGRDLSRKSHLLIEGHW